MTEGSSAPAAAGVRSALTTGRDDLLHDPLKLDFDPTDRDRMHELAARGQEGSLSKAEEEELDSYRRIGYFVDLMRSKARLSLKQHGR